MINFSVDVANDERCSFVRLLLDYVHAIAFQGTFYLVLCVLQNQALASFKTCARDPFQVEERIPMVKRANEAVEAAAEKVRQLKLELFERGVKTEQLNRQLAATEVEVDQTRDRANKLEERFTQVGNEDAPTASCFVSNPTYVAFSSF